MQVTGKQRPWSCDNDEFLEQQGYSAETPTPSELKKIAQFNCFIRFLIVCPTSG